MGDNTNLVETLSDNPDFIPSVSTNEVYIGNNMELCLTDVLEEKADINHTHSEYSPIGHTHSGYASQDDLDLLEDILATKADSTHTHSDYATVDHIHSDYVLQVDFDALESEVDGKASVSHAHSEYATTESVVALQDEIDTKAEISHVHTEYSAIDHVHTDYATQTSLDELSATVSNKANASHSHDDTYYTEIEIDTKLAGKADSSHTHTGVYDVNGAAANALTSANAYTDSKIDALVGEGASTTLDTIGEISAAIEGNQDAIDLLNSAIANKANTVDLTTHTGNMTIHVTEADKNNWDAAKTHSDSAHAPANAEANQNAFGNIVIGSTTISADSEIDTLTFVAGNNIVLTPNVEGDSVTIAAVDTVYSHPTSAGNKHIPAGGSSGQILRWSADGTATWGADNDTKYSVATQSASGLMSDTDKAKLDGIAEGANNYVLPSAGSSLGGVKTGGDVAISSGVITVNDDSHNHIISNVDGLQNALDAKAENDHNHDNVYYTETEIDTLLAGKSDSAHNHDASYDVLGAAEEKANAVQANLNTVNDELMEHIDDADIHFTATERTKLSGIAAGANNYSHPNSGVTAGTYKSVTVNAQGHITGGTNPTTLAGYGITDAESKGAANNALTSAKEYTDDAIADEVVARDSAISTAKSSAISTAASDATTKANNALASAKTYADSVGVAVKNDLLNGAGTAYDTLKELGDLIGDNADAISALESVASGKANAAHTHEIEDVTNLQSALDGKAAASHSHTVANITDLTATAKELNYMDGVTSNVQTQLDAKAASGHTHTIANVSGLQSTLDGKAASSHGTHVTYSTTAPVMDGTASVGSATTVARSDHKHPTDTTRAAQTDLDTHVSDTTKHITSTERTNWGTAYTHSQTAHAPSNAEKNQNAFSYVKVGSTSVAADSATDTLTFVAGTNVTITPDATGDSITISSTDTNTTYSAGTGISLSGTTFSNSGVRSISTGSSNGTISVNTNGTSANVAVKGLGSAAYTASTAYDAAGTAQTKADAALASAKAYTDSVKSDLLNGAGAAYDTLKELGDLIDENVDAIEALETVAASKASASDLTSHTSNKSNPHSVTLAQLGVTATASELNKMDGITATTAELNIMDGVTATTAEINYLDGVTSSIQTQLNGKAASSHGTHVTYGTATPKANGTAAVGTATTVSRSDHVHPLQTTISGNAGTATKLATARTISLTGDVSGSVSFDGSANASITTTVADDSHNHVISNVDGLQTALDAKAASSHTHSYAGSSSAGGAATSANKLATARTISLTGDVSGSTSFDGSGNVSITATVADDSHNHVISNIDGLQSALDVKSDNDHRHYAINIAVEGEDLNNYTDAGFYTFANAYAPANTPSGNTNGWLLVIPWQQGNATVKQIWFRHGTINSNDFETYVRTKIGTYGWSNWSKYYTTENPPTPAEIGAAAAFTSANGGVEIGINVADNKNLLDKIDSLATGVYTIYSQSGVSGNPKTTEAWRMLVHKTSATIGWVMAFGSSGSVYANYQNEASHFQGWRCVYEATNSMILWTGAYYMHSPSSTPQIVTPSKKLSECRTGWLLLWSDYDASTGTTNDSDFATTFIPKYNPAGGTWGGKAFYCDVPMYVGSDVTDISTEQRVIKPIYIHDDCIKGSYQNNQGGRNDVVLRAVYEV